MQTNIWTVIGLGIVLFGPLVRSFNKRLLKKEFSSLISKLFLWVLAAFIVLIIFFGENESLISIGFKKITTRTIIIGLIGGIGSMVIMGLSHFIFNKIGVKKVENTLEKITSLSNFHIIFIVFTAAFVEEILYRGYAIERLSLFTNNIWIAGIISTLFFTAAHVIRWSIPHLIPVFLTGLFLTFLYITEKDIIACIIAHFIVDGVAFILMPYILKKKAINTN
jgi:membrane protease YdiL (CAAX protease family)